LIMQIRHAMTNDAPSIIENNILLAKESEDEKLNHLIAKKGVYALFSTPEKGFYLVAEENDTIIGQLMITFEWSDWRNKDIWWIQSVYVHKKYRNNGVFTSLYNEIQNQARKQNISLLRLYVHKDNIVAQQVYEKLKMAKGTYVFYEKSV
jgi:GNAT superfamily N-acetyltransferase